VHFMKNLEDISAVGTLLYVAYRFGCVRITGYVVRASPPGPVTGNR
jgi:hypothetical protein